MYYRPGLEPVSVQGQQTHYAKSNLVKGRHICSMYYRPGLEPVPVQGQQTYYS